MIVVREATPRDSEGIRDVDISSTATLREVYQLNQTALANRSKISAKRFQSVALINSRVVGIAQYYLKDDRVHIMGLGVHIDFRRLGVAKALLAYIEDIGRSNRARCLSLYTVKETGNVDIFMKMGFRTLSEQCSELFGSDKYESLIDVYMEKPLSASNDPSHLDAI